MPNLETIILTRETQDNQRIAAHLPSTIRIMDYPCVSTRLLTPSEKELLQWLSPLPDALAVTSRRAVESLKPHGGLLRRLDPPVAAVGHSTSGAVETGWGITPTWLPPDPTGRSLGGVLAERLSPGARVLYLRGDLSTGELSEALLSAGIHCDEQVVYENPSPDIERLEFDGLAVATFSSPSAVIRFMRTNPGITPRIVAVAAGPTTEAALKRGRFAMVRQAAGPGSRDMAQCILDVMGGTND